MTEFQSTHRVEQDATHATKGDGLSAFCRQAQLVKQEWQDGTPQSLASFLSARTSLCGDRSVVIELAVEEYQQRRKAGQESNVARYCDPFLKIDPALYSSIFRQIEVEKFLDDHPAFRTEDETVQWPNVGQQIGVFRVHEEIGRGALARVYLCSQTNLGNRQVVVKVSRRGIREGGVLGKLQHPHIMPVYSVDAQEEDGLTFLCTPFLGRSTLHDLLRTEFLSGTPGKAVAIVQAAKLLTVPTDRTSNGPASSYRWQRRSYVHGIIHLGITLADALSHAHDAGVVHGDLKPSNILLTPAGEPILLDFNLARDDASSPIIYGGTLPYMSPEQLAIISKGASDPNKSAGVRSEIFSLGVMLYELLAGKLPFDCSEAGNLSTTRLSESQASGPKPLKQRNPHVGNTLAAKIERCLAYSPEDRFPSMRDLREALAAELKPLPCVSRWVLCHRRTTVIASIFLVLFTTVFSWWAINRPPYYMRQYNRGRQQQATGSFKAALDSYKRSAEAQPDFIDAAFAQARINLKLEETDKALEQFVALAQKHNHAPSMACVAYCFNLKGQPTLAVPWYRKALNAGLETAGIHNNLASSIVRDSANTASTTYLLRAENHLEKALALWPNLPNAHLNLAMLELERTYQEKNYSPDKGLASIEFLLQEGYEGADIYLLWAELSIPLANDPANVSRVIDRLIDASYRGVNVNTSNFYDARYFHLIQKHPRFPELLAAVEQQAFPSALPKLPYVIDPLKSLD